MYVEVHEDSEHRRNATSSAVGFKRSPNDYTEQIANASACDTDTSGRVGENSCAT